MGEKTFYLLDRKVKRKNQVSEYHILSPKRYDEDKYVNDQLMKNLLTQ